MEDSMLDLQGADIYLEKYTFSRRLWPQWRAQGAIIASGVNESQTVTKILQNRGFISENDGICGVGLHLGALC